VANRRDEGLGGLAHVESKLGQFILAQGFLRRAIEDDLAVQLKATGDDHYNSLFSIAATVAVNSGDASEALRTVQQLKGDIGLLLIHNALQFLVETRLFLGACFSKVAVGGLMVITVPHQFLYERKLRLPSRRNRLHRRFYTPNTLLADIEEAIDPCEYRVRFLADCDVDYDYRADLSREPDGGQDIVVALEKFLRLPWRADLDRAELAGEAATQPVPYLKVNKQTPALTRTIIPDRQGIGRIIVLKLDHRGDFLMAREAFKLLRNAFKSSQITLVCGTWNVAEAGKTLCFDDVIPFDYFPEDHSARLEAPTREDLLKKFARLVQGNYYDLAVDLRLYEDTRDVLRLIKARNHAGFDRYDSFPWLTIRMNIPSATDDDRAEQGVITADHFATSVCKHLAYEIRADELYRSENWRSIIWGPYQELKPGRYQFQCLMEPLGEDFEVPFDIVADSGKQTLLAGVLPISRNGHPRVHFETTMRHERFEFRIISRSGFVLKPFRFFGLHFVRPSVVRGVHQSEAMALLAHLVGLRLNHAYTTEVD
jgi:hypothetical protein